MKQIQEAIDSLKRKNGTLNTRFLSEKYIEEFSLKPEAKILLDNGIRNPQDIYDFENSTDDKCPGINGLRCPDLAKRRFINYKNGYVPQCKKCRNWRNQEKAHNKRFDKTNPDHVLKKYNIDVKSIKDSDYRYHSHFIGIIKENLLLNTNGKIEGQRINRNYFDDRGLLEAYNLLIKYNIVNAECLYKYENNDSGLCECGSEKRFIEYGLGYKDNCEECSRSKYNWMKLDYKTVDLELDEVLNYISIESGKYSTSNIKKLSETTINKIVHRTKYLVDASISERLYHIENNLYSVKKCSHCSRDNRSFISSISGYKETCSSKCGYANVDYDKRTLLIRAKLFEHHINKFNAVNEELGEDYTVGLFSREEYINTKYPNINFKHSCGHNYVLGLDYQGSYKCPKCFRSRSNQQYKIFDFINTQISDEVLYDDRKLLNGQELDILVPERKFAIEYNSNNFHSFGINTYTPFNNADDESLKKDNHLNKTEMCEDLGIQLFHIFSSDNQEIWKSMISNKLGLSNKIYARKCIIKEVDNKEAKEFQELNHLQGSVNASIKLGLYYEDELVSLMTFGKARYTKTAEYELIRFCSKLNTSVVGGASKLLKYFERNYSPKSLVSYANRRWSTGNLYNQLGFDLSHVSKPNYFYFQGNDGVLESRVKYQKHKLSKVLENFDPNKTESENMYLNGFRKIYDSGNLVYIKNY